MFFEPQNSNFENYDLILVHAKTKHVLTYYQNFKSSFSVLSEISLSPARKISFREKRVSSTILQYIAICCIFYNIQAIDYTCN